jgi:hypothetical protein
MKRIAPVFSFGLLLSLAAACGGPIGEPAYGGLDVTGDGVLDVDDVEDGEIAVFFQRLDESTGEPTEVEAVAASTSEASISPGGSFGWYLNATVDGAELSVRFEAESIAVGAGTITNASYEVDDEHFAYASEPGGEVEIVEVNDDGASASGRLVGEPELEVFGAMEQPTGETVKIGAFAFKTIPVVME